MAKHKFIKFLSIAYACICLFSCDANEMSLLSGYGKLEVQLTADSKTIELGGSTDSSTRNKADSTASSIVNTRVSDDTPAVESFELFLYANNILTDYWERFSQFDPEAQIPIGQYEMKAVYGDIEEEGYYRPCYMGSSVFQIRDREKTDVEITCQLANVKVSVECTEAVKKYFPVFSMQARSDLGDDIIITRDETRSIYLKPGLLVLSAEFEKQNGKTGKVELLRVEGTEAKQHYVITVDVNQGNVGGGALQISYNTVAAEEVKEIDLSDASLNIKQPTFTTQGFESGDSKTMREGAQPEAMKVTLNARAGIATCDLFINSPYLQSLGIAQQVNLASTDPAQIATKEALEEKGLRLIGFEELDKLALIDFTPLIMNLICTGLEDETTTFKLKATDKGGRTEESEVTLSMTMQNNRFAFPAITNAVMIGSTEAYASINLLAAEDSGNGETDVENVIFEYQKEDGTWVAATTEWAGDDISDETLHFVRIKNLPPVHSKVNIRARYGSKTSDTQVLNYSIPDFTLTANAADIWARKATVEVKANTEDELKAILKYMKIKVGSEEKATLDETTATYTLTDLTPGATYAVSAECNGEKSANYSLNTEAATQLPNSDFEGTWNTVYNSTINKGGPWAKRDGVIWFGAATAIEAYETTTLTALEPQGWCTVNSKTMPETATQENTWYIVPSTNKGIMSNSNCAKIQNVGWNNLGETIGALGKIGLGITAEYRYDNFPGFDKLKVPGLLTYSAGRLFLGSYSCSHSTSDVNAYTETYNEGLSFTSRPESISFSYKYISKVDDTADKGFVRISLKDKDGNDILTKNIYETLDHTGENTVLSKTINFSYPANCAKAATICVMFCSSITGKDDNEKTINHHDIGHADYKAQCCVTGSELYIDNIVLNY